MLEYEEKVRHILDYRVFVRHIYYRLFPPFSSPTRMTRLPAPTSPIHGALTLPAPYAAVIGINERLGQWAIK